MMPRGMSWKEAMAEVRRPMMPRGMGGFPSGRFDVLFAWLEHGVARRAMPVPIIDWSSTLWFRPMYRRFAAK